MYWIDFKRVSGSVGECIDAALTTGVSVDATAEGVSTGSPAADAAATVSDAPSADLESNSITGSAAECADAAVPAGVPAGASSAVGTGPVIETETAFLK
jgi:hypothetical protein